MADEEVATKAPESDAQEDAGKNPTTEDPVARAAPTMGVRLDGPFMESLKANNSRNIAQAIDLLVRAQTPRRQYHSLIVCSNWRGSHWSGSA